jgi:hypothetical protein
MNLVWNDTDLQAGNQLWTITVSKKAAAKMSNLLVIIGYSLQA